MHFCKNRNDSSGSIIQDFVDELHTYSCTIELFIHFKHENTPGVAVIETVTVIHTADQSFLYLQL
jgi:hypothetical protein